MQLRRGRGRGNAGIMTTIIQAYCYVCITNITIMQTGQSYWSYSILVEYVEVYHSHDALFDGCQHCHGHTWAEEPHIRFFNSWVEIEKPIILCLHIEAIDILHMVLMFDGIFQLNRMITWAHKKNFLVRPNNLITTGFSTGCMLSSCQRDTCMTYH